MCIKNDYVRYVKGSIFWAEIGDEENPIHPVIIISDCMKNHNLGKVMYVPCTTKEKVTNFSGVVELMLGKPTYAKLNSIDTITVDKLKNFIGILNADKMEELANTIRNYMLEEDTTPSSYMNIVSPPSSIIDVKYEEEEKQLELEQEETNVINSNTTLPDKPKDDVILKYLDHLNELVPLGMPKNMTIANIEIFLVQYSVYGTEEMSLRYNVEPEWITNKVITIKTFLIRKFGNTFKSKKEITESYKAIAREIKKILA